MQIDRVILPALRRDEGINAIEERYAFLEEEGVDVTACTEHVLSIRPIAVLGRNHMAGRLSFPFVLTLGVEFDELQRRAEHCADSRACGFLVSELALLLLEQGERSLDRQCIRSVDRARRKGRCLATHYYGAHHDLPLDDIRRHFDRLEPSLTQAGIALSENLAMHPSKTVSGVKWFSRHEEGSSRCSRCNIAATCEFSKERVMANSQH